MLYNTILQKPIIREKHRRKSEKELITKKRLLPFKSLGQNFMEDEGSEKKK